jgi:hypothetical protein
MITLAAAAGTAAILITTYVKAIGWAKAPSHATTTEQL